MAKQTNAIRVTKYYTVYRYDPMYRMECMSKDGEVYWFECEDVNDKPLRDMLKAYNLTGDDMMVLPKIDGHIGYAGVL